MKTRDYKIKFRISIGDPQNQKSSNFLKYYMPKWSSFMRIIMSRKLNSMPTEKTSSVKELPLLRPLIKPDLKTADIIELLTRKDQDLARLLLEVSPLFDESPRDLKAHIFAVFGIKEKELREFLEKPDYK